jgi:multidrug efflux pump subunit AcrA (membrane-fusion protein)
MAIEQEHGNQAPGSGETGNVPINEGTNNGAFPASDGTGGTAIDQANGNRAAPDSGETEKTAIDLANDNGEVPASAETATTGGRQSGNGARPEMTPLEAWVPGDPALSDPASARATVAQPSSPESGRVFPREAPVPVHPPPLAPSAGPGQAPPPPTRKPHTWPQRAGVILIAATCVAAAVWYVPRVVSTNRQMFTGSVASGGVLTLNFPNPGEIRRIQVRPGQTVHKGQVLASESAPDASAVVKAETAAIAADRAKIAQLKSAQAQGVLSPTTGVAQLSAANAQLAFDQAQLNSNKAKLAASRITAPASGVVVAANGQPGQVVTSSGIRDYAADSQSSPASQRPAFSLLPEGPQPLRSNSPRESTLPVITLRTSEDWTVVALIPENAASRVTQGTAVMISVPAAGIKDVPGKIDELLPSPVTSAQGTAYQAVVKITGHAKHAPLNGMAADIQLN